MSRPTPTTPPPPRPRLASLDAFRGLTVAGMILANNPGSWSAIYPPLRHADWHGWTPTDLIFPSFLFIVGVSIALAISTRIDRGAARGAILAKVAWRSAIIFGIGLALNGFPDYHLATIRIPGVLQRIALCYLAAALLFLALKPRGLAIAIGVLLAGYTLAMASIPVPGHGAGDLSRDGNLAASIDRALLSGHIYKPDYDPEGLLSTLPAVATTLIGVLAGLWLRSGRAAEEVTARLFVAGAAGIVLGWATGGSVPINKALWTVPFVLLAGGFALQGLAVGHWLIDVEGYRRWARPFVILGVNPIAAFVLSGLGARALGLIQVAGPTAGELVSLKGAIYANAFTSWLSPMNASLAFAVAYLLFWTAVMALLDRFKIFIKV